MASLPRTGLTRRQFVGAAAALAAGSTRADASQTPAAEGFGGFTVGAQSYSFRNFNFERALGQIRDLGLRYVELFRGHLPTSATDAQLDAAKTLLRQHNITPIAFGVENFTRDEAANRRLFEFGRKLGIRYFSANPDADSFDNLDRLVAEYNIGIAIHPHGPVGGNPPRLDRWYSAERIMAGVRAHDRRIGSCLDTGHLIRSAQPPFNERLDPAEQVRVMGARNFGLHLKDHDNQRRTDVVFGRGPLDVLAVLRALRAVNFQGYISLEYEANPNDPAPDMRACLDVFRAAVRRLE
jgi:inosose dehydratase